MVHCHQFPRFGQASDSLPLVLVVCKSVPVGEKVAALLHGWAESADGTKAYVGFLDAIRNTSPPNELMLSLSALTVL